MLRLLHGQTILSRLSGELRGIDYYKMTDILDICKKIVATSNCELESVILTWIKTYPDVSDEIIDALFYYFRGARLRKNPKLPLVTLTMTTCKRLSLFIQTIDSFLYHCTDHSLIYHWLCIDDGSSEEDREIMRQKYPFFEYIWKDDTEKGHARSINILSSKICTPLVFHLEDDWLFEKSYPFVSECLRVLTHDSANGQCLLNKNYAETGPIEGGIVIMDGSLGYLVHDYHPTEWKNPVSYWPHFSLRPGVWKRDILQTGKFDESPHVHFEREYAYRYIANGWRTTFLNGFYCRHIGRLTHERGDILKPNAYQLNEQPQFGIASISYPIWMINLERRRDRLVSCSKAIESWKCSETYLAPLVRRIPGIDGQSMTLSRQCWELFYNNDYNFRSGIIGCALTHIQCWIEIMNTSRAVLIIEDDITPLRDIPEQLFVGEFDIRFLGYHPRENLNREPSRLLRVNAQRALEISQGGTFAYIVSPNGARKLCQYIHENGMSNAIDTMMQKFADVGIVEYCVPSYVSSPMFPMSCYGESDLVQIDTDIQGHYDTLWKSLETYVSKEILYFETRGVCVHLIDRKFASTTVILNINHVYCIDIEKCTEVDFALETEHISATTLSFRECVSKYFDILLVEDYILLIPEGISYGYRLYNEEGQLSFSGLLND